MSACPRLPVRGSGVDERDGRESEKGEIRLLPRGDRAGEHHAATGRLCRRVSEGEGTGILDAFKGWFSYDEEDKSGEQVAGGTPTLPSREKSPKGKPAGKAKRVAELTGKHTENARYRMLSDGRVQAEVPAVPSGYRAGKSWKDIDPTVTPDAKWPAAPERRYPVTIDPTIPAARTAGRASCTACRSTARAAPSPSAADPMPDRIDISWTSSSGASDSVPVYNTP
ncbi:hypothetical protein [Streptomyces sp. NPDC093089]|uniref:hypothetical protein n=1 Tax=Streptomyces sp. NPDC093089 TaxID=3366024 RepID=UPI003821E98E